MLTIYSKKGCSFCAKALELLNSEDLPFSFHDITGDDKMVKHLLEKTSKFNHKTFPFIFNDDVFIGGYTELKNIIDCGFLNNENNDF